MADKARERWYLDGARSQGAVLPRGEALDSESPDFIIASDGCVVGVEVTRFARPCPRQPPVLTEQERLRRAVVRAARKRATRWDCPPLLVTACLDSRIPLCPPDVPEAARALAEAALAHAASVGPHAVRSISQHDGGLPSPLSWLLLAFPTGRERPRWSAVSDTEIANVRLEDIEAVIAKKARLVPRYRTLAWPVWLLIVVDPFSPSSLARLTPEVVQHSYDSPFAGVALYDPSATGRSAA